MLGVVECRDHKRRKGPAAIEGFAKKTENLGANLRMMVSKKGFTPQALRLAAHEHIDCLSLLPDDPKETGFTVGHFWYATISKWTNVRLTVAFKGPVVPIDAFDSRAVKWQGKPVMNWFLRELFTTHQNVADNGERRLGGWFEQPRMLEIEGQDYEVVALFSLAYRVHRKKRKWVSWTGDGLYDWHKGQFIVPPGGTVVGSAVDRDFSTWDDFDGELPVAGNLGNGEWLLIGYDTNRWDSSRDLDVPDLRTLFATNIQLELA
jgi:hypothetical protein